MFSMQELADSGAVALYQQLLHVCRMHGRCGRMLGCAWGPSLARIAFLFPLQVLRGADRNIDMVVKDPDLGILESNLWSSSGSVDREIKADGKYMDLHALPQTQVNFCFQKAFGLFLLTLWVHGTTSDGFLLRSLRVKIEPVRLGSTVQYTAS